MKIPIQNIRIRRASCEDAALICRLYHETVTSLDKASYTKDQIQKLVSFCADDSKWEQKISEDHYLLAVDDDKPYGFCSLQSNGCIDTLYVPPAHQHTGVATSLLNAVYELAEEIHVPILFANVSLEAISFYEQNGFIVRETSSRDIDGIHFTNVLVDKRLWL